MNKILIALVASFLATLSLAAPVVPKIPGYRLLATSDTKPAFWVPVEVAETLGNSDLEFIDITDFQDADPSLAPKVADLPASPAHQDVVKALIPNIDIDLYEKNLITFSNSWRNRYYTSDYGVQSSNWVFELVSALVANRSDITVSRFTHTFKQPSVIAKIAGTKSDEIVILGAHQDSTAPSMPSGSAPGADDDGSGSMGIYEILRVIVEAGFRPERSIEFHWYAAEEVGLLGSQAVANSYQARSAPVYSMMQLDMIAYNGKESTVGIVTDYVDADTIEFNRKLVTEYLDIGYTNTVCGYGCSDHASWNRYGYRASFPFEAQFRNRNPLIHTTSDTMNLVSVEHAKEFIKLGLAFAIELSYV